MNPDPPAPEATIGSGLRIGISACRFGPDPQRPIFKGKTLLYLEQSLSWWVQSTGAVTYLVPPVPPDGSLPSAAYAADLDGLVLAGGSDVCPRTYGEEPIRPEWEGDEVRDRYEIDLVRRFLDASKPVLGVCRGHQILNVAFGGTLWQDLVAQEVTDHPHRDQGRYDRLTHEVEIRAGSGLAELYPGRTTGVVNSVHHQAIKDLGDGLAIEAVSRPDGVIESARAGADLGWALGVQWHPEFVAGVDDGTMLDPTPLIRSFVEACAGCGSGRG